MKKVIYIILALIYIFSPIDILPDVIPVLGWLDDIAIGGGAGLYALLHD